MGGTPSISMACTASSNDQKFSFIMSLESSWRLFPHETAHGICCRAVCNAFFSPSFLSPPLENFTSHLKFQSFSLIYWYFSFDPYFFFLIFIPYPFIKFWFVFNFILQFKFLICYFFSIWSSFFWFFCTFSKLIFLFNFTLPSKFIVETNFLKFIVETNL
jgi:hypothetical protein